MSKRVDTSSLDADFIIGQAKKGYREQMPDPVPPQTNVPFTPQVEAPPPEFIAPAVVQASPTTEPSREETRRRKAKADPQDFKAMFIHEASITARSGKTVYISKEHHDRITKILQVIGKNEVSLFSYIYNVLEHHFSNFQEDMNELYESNLERKLF